MNRPIRFASILLAGLLAGPAVAAVYTVGPMAGCTHASVQAALDALLERNERPKPKRG